MVTTIKVEQKTRTRVMSAKYLLGLTSADETINKVFDVAEQIKNADENISNLLAKQSQEKKGKEMLEALE